MNEEHGKGCKCTNEYDDYYTCPWYGREEDFNYVPFSLRKCQICFALVGPSIDIHDHMRWHEKRGDLDG